MCCLGSLIPEFFAHVENVFDNTVKEHIFFLKKKTFIFDKKTKQKPSFIIIKCKFYRQQLQMKIGIRF